MYKKRLRTIILFVLAISLSLPTALPSLFNVAAATTISGEVVVPGFTPYSEIPEILEELNDSARVLVQVIGQSVGGHDLYLAIVADPAVLDNLDEYREFANLTVEDPESARELVDNGIDYKATVFITGSIHGDEMMGTDACLDLMELLAYEHTEEVESILNNTISLIYVCVNPDGRIANMRYNDNYFDVNRDWLTASQPEVRAGIEYVYKEWAPLVNIDLHGYMGEDYVLIEPCTPLHNPNAEEDLLLLNEDAHLLPMAENMEARLQEIGIDTLIPYRDWTATWDDYPPIFTPMYGFYHGCFGITFESTDPYDKNGSPEISINAQYTGMLGAYEYIVENKDDMFWNQTEIFRRGIINNHWLNGTYGGFPYAFVLPMDPELQMDPIQTAKMVDFAIFHGIKVHMASENFTVTENGIEYPAGTYVVLMNQPRAGLAMNMFWYGEDTSLALNYPPYDTYAWNFPELWGFTRIQANETFDAELVEVEEALYPIGGVEGDADYGYALKDDTNNAIILVNRLLKKGINVYSAMEPFTDDGIEFGVGTFIIPVQEDYITENATSLHLTLYGLSEEPLIDKTLLARAPRVAILFASGVYTPAYGATQFILKNLEFDFDVLNYVDIRKGKLRNYDIIIVTDGSAGTIWTKLANKGQRKLLEFIENGGTYFGFGEGGGYLVNYAKFLDASARRAKWYGGYNNGIVRLNYTSTDPIAAYYPEVSYAYAFFPVWFENLGNYVEIVASYASDGMFLAGWWPGQAISGEAKGKGAVIRGTYGEGNVILSGIEPTFRAHTEFTFRLVANAIFFAASE